MQTLSNTSNLGDVVNFFISTIYLLLPLFVGLSFLAFLFGIVKFIFQSGDQKSHAEGIKFMVWSLVALFVLVSFMGIISFFYKDLGFYSSHNLIIPQLNS
jgi:heme/copper-type cytochrome/quinol oxidase subunit 2